ncbi:DUF5710 domain-containing protein [Methylomonas sp. SURF-2]|uniref:DUF5710 domain-containing protein n=1 Tax=Methylomonas subterranea TaxID=2952225 RepID=A0ABT1TKC7_9GAMM|nr:DUF5710 domain-containing protein [Methylomonas sp. SURF-2]MCQ8105661.1 DUF5710 domain-containing protein [Methylomonas sp. SURF-2]
MAKTITYLNVPYAEKDQAKALGARWDAANKKWYAPLGKDIEPFARWLNGAPISTAQPAAKPAPRPSEASAGQASGVFTYPTIADFVAYDGEQPPWD